MDVYDLVVLPVYLGIIYLLATFIRGKNSSNRLYQNYFFRGLNYKIIGGVGFACIYWFYYKGGDSLNFFYAAKCLHKLFYNNPYEYFSFVLSIEAPWPHQCWWDAYSYDVLWLVRGSASLTSIKIASIVNLLAFNSFMAVTLIYSFITYLFTWKAFELFASLYPKLEKELAIGFLMLPSVIFWGSAIGKDSVTLAAIMNLICCFYELVIKKRIRIMNIISILITIYIISLVRGYVLYTLSASLILMTAIYYRNLLSSATVRFIALPVFVLGGLGGAYLFIQSIGSSASSYSLDSLQKTAEGFHSWHTTLGASGGSFYSLGNDVDYTPIGIIKKAPLALIITQFGPFIWQIRNPVMFISGMESLIFLFFFIKVFVNVRIYRAYDILFKDHIIMFCICFIAILGVAIGMTSFNYGALVRYRIPILPFFVALLSITSLKIYGRGILSPTKRIKI